jgi:transcriptional regulator GlxA family with amidase domain
MALTERGPQAGDMPTPVPLSEPIRSVLRDVVDDPAGDHSLEAMAAKAVVSVRHLNRLFGQHIGITPARYVEGVRVAAARGLLPRSSPSLASVASRAGFGSVETMRRAFLRAGHPTPGAYRDRSRSTTEEQ